MPSLAADGMTLDMRWEPGEVWIEPDLFKTLLINLIDNARKASRRGQTVELYGRREEGGYAFFVRDHGRGMKPEDLARIEEPFYMIDKSRSPRPERRRPRPRAVQAHSRAPRHPARIHERARRGHDRARFPRGGGQ